MSIRRDDADYAALMERLEAPTPKLPGYWLCVVWIHPGMIVTTNGAARSLGNNEWLSNEPFPSEDVADMRGAKDVEEANAFFGWEALRYVRAEFFPDYSGERP